MIYYESVRAGHPDKMCDFISDSILNAYYSEDKNSRVACECFFVGKTLILGGEISSKAKVDVLKVAKETIESIGYSAEDFDIYNFINSQSFEINNLVNSSSDLGAGDQGVTIGYACKGINELPKEFYFIQDLMRSIDEFMKAKLESLKGLMPDGKGFIKREGNKVRVHVSYEAKNDNNTESRQNVLRGLIEDLYYNYFQDNDAELEITFTEYHLGGPLADTGLTGRKIIVDTYGGIAPHGGGAFSGKDPTKVDRTGAYLARQFAKSILNKVDCDEATVWLGYAIGEPRPVSVKVKTVGNNSKFTDDALELLITKLLEQDEFSLKNVIERYFNKVDFNRLSSYGHFGNEEFEWEKVLEL